MKGTVTLVCMLILLAGCNSSTLSTSEAEKLIMDSPGGKEMIYGHFNISTDYEIGARVLGDMVKKGLVQGSGDHYVVTDKAKPYIQSFTKQLRLGNERGPSFFADVAIGRPTLEIKEILVDEKAGEARVTVVTGREPVEPYYSLFCGGERKGRLGVCFGLPWKPETGVIPFKKYDKGWRIGY